jgi:uncharacterized membrane protein
VKHTLSFHKLLFCLFAFIASLLLLRGLFSGSFNYLFLVWNLFLAWIPFVISGYFKKLKVQPLWLQLFVFCCWLAFFPNALYIVTDLIHLDKESIVPKWFDAVLLFSSSITGLIMAFISLFRVEVFLCDKIHKKFQPFLLLLILFLGSFGVYLGRFLRWNSWDIISNPLQLFVSITERFIYPFDHLQTWIVTIILTIFFYLLYLAIKNLPGYLAPRQDGSRPSDAFRT